jgi:hypothetical protein
VSLLLTVKEKPYDNKIDIDFMRNDSFPNNKQIIKRKKITLAGLELGTINMKQQ